MINYGVTDLAKSFRTVRGNTVQAARDIPEDKYDFAAAPGTRTVSELLRHIAFVDMIHFDFHRDRKLTTLAGYDFGAFLGRMAAEQSKQMTKAQIIELLEARGEAFAKWLESLSNDFLNETYTDPTGQHRQSRFEHLLSAKEHEMHHRGQLMLIQRTLGLTPHLTLRQQERMRARAAAPAKG